MPDSAPLELSALSDGAATTVHIAGEIDLATADEVQSFLREQLDGTTEAITLRLAEVTFIGSEGLRILIWLRAECARRQVGLVVGDCSPIVVRTFGLCGLTEVFLGEQDTA
ncbi:STAS domain-containing protein [Lentzea sp. NPDC051838]|uniref:STAS domain-containing protein n=1 Tax=Lentzea sp. NPDC051838 TaxID=3154849 RepID=UPI003429D9DA